MNSRKNLIIALLAATTVASGFLAWQQYDRRSHTMVTLGASNDELLKKLAAAERHAADLDARLAALQAAPGTDSPAAPSGDVAAAAGRRDQRREQGNNRRAEMEALMNTPEVQQLMASQQRAGLDARYAALFKELNLSPAQLETFKNLLLEKQNSRRDVMAAARESGVNTRESRDELQKLVQQANAETDAAIAAAIGQEKFDQYQNYEATGSQRALVDQLNRTMGYSATGLTDAQSQALVQILAANSSSENSRQRGGPTVEFAGPWGGGGPSNVTITDTVITQAQTILSPAQLKVLQEQQQTQQNAQKLREIMRPQNQDQPRR